MSNKLSTQHAMIFPSLLSATPPRHARLYGTIFDHLNECPPWSDRPPTTHFCLKASLWSCSDSELFKIPLPRSSVVLRRTIFLYEILKTFSYFSCQRFGLRFVFVHCLVFYYFGDCIYKLDKARLFIQYLSHSYWLDN